MKENMKEKRTINVNQDLVKLVILSLQDWKMETGNAPVAHFLANVEVLLINTSKKYI